VFEKKQTGRCSLEYEASVEEALCFGWIDSLIKRIDDAQYCRKFTPRKNSSAWSRINKQRVDKLIKTGRMTPYGLEKIEAAKRFGSWTIDRCPMLDFAMPPELSAALARNREAKAFFETLAPGHQKRFIAWITLAMRPETKTKRLEESLMLLGRGEKLGLK
jgi:uncharacterized protein YdeI (YjbR/CyaY-like superfamily)